MPSPPLRRRNLDAILAKLRCNRSGCDDRRRRAIEVPLKRWRASWFHRHRSDVRNEGVVLGVVARHVIEKQDGIEVTELPRCQRIVERRLHFGAPHNVGKHVPKGTHPRVARCGTPIHPLKLNQFRKVMSRNGRQQPQRDRGKQREVPAGHLFRKGGCLVSEVVVQAYGEFFHAPTIPLWYDPFKPSTVASTMRPGTMFRKCAIMFPWIQRPFVPSS